MTMFKQRRCFECGVGSIRLATEPGRYASYKTFERLPVPPDLAIPTCDNCGAQWFDDEHARAFDESLEIEYRAEILHRVVTALDILVKYITQRDLERLLGLSHGYLSKLRSGSRNASPELLACLALLVGDPESRLEELSNFWRSSTLVLMPVMDCFDIVRRLRAKIADLETKLERAVVIGTDHEGAYWLEVTTAENLRADLAKVERERDEARANYQFMVDHAANEKLDGYRQLGQRAATAENERDEVRQRLAETERCRWDAEDSLTAERERTKRRTEQLEICRREVVRLTRLVNEGKDA